MTAPVKPHPYRVGDTVELKGDRRVGRVTEVTRYSVTLDGCLFVPQSLIERKVEEEK